MAADNPARTSSRKASVCESSVLSKADPRELPARARRKEVAIRGPAVPPRCGAARALQHELAAHEFAIVFANCAGRGGEARVGSEGTLRPLPDIAEHAAARARRYSARFVELIAKHRVRGGGEILPFGFGRQSRPRPACEGIRFEIADVRDWCRPVDLAPAAEGELGFILAPVERRRNVLLLDPGPALRQP